MTATTEIVRSEGPDRTVSITLPVMPQPAPRPRVTRGGIAYYPATYRAFQKELEQALPPAAETFEGELVVEVECVCKPIGKSKFTTPMGDCDNLAKGPLDALTKRGYYGDDRQIVSLLTKKRFPRKGEEPHIRIEITEV